MTNPAARFAGMTAAERQDLGARYARFNRTGDLRLVTFAEAELLVWLADRPAEPPRCPYCDRVMTWREKDEQGACNDCYDDQGRRRL